MYACMAAAFAGFAARASPSRIEPMSSRLGKVAATGWEPRSDLLVIAQMAGIVGGPEGPATVAHLDFEEGGIVHHERSAMGMVQAEHGLAEDADGAAVSEDGDCLVGVVYL